MKRGIWILLLAVVLGLATAGIFSLMGRGTAPAEWVGREFGLEGEQARKAAALHENFQGRCMELCARIQASDEHLQALVDSHRSVTPEIRAAIAENDQLRTDCRTHMLEHFYEMAAMLPADQRSKYLGMVVPTVLHPAEISLEHLH